MWYHGSKDNIGSAVWAGPCSKTVESFLSSSKLRVQASNTWRSWPAVPTLQSLTVSTQCPPCVCSCGIKTVVTVSGSPLWPQSCTHRHRVEVNIFLGTQFNCTFIFICIKKMPISIRFLKFWGFKNLDKLLLMLQSHQAHNSKELWILNILYSLVQILLV